MSSWRDTFLNLSIDARHAYAARCKRVRGKWGRLPLFSLTQYVKCSKQDVLNFAKRHKVWTKGDMEIAIRNSKKSNPPTSDMLLFLFGSWETFLKELHSEAGYRTFFSDMTDEQLAICCSQLPIKNKNDYMNIRKTDAGSYLPPACAVERRFGNFAMFMNVVLSFRVDYQFQKYFEESVRAGHLLTLEECDNLQIELRYLLSVLSPDFFFLLLEEKMNNLSDKEQRKLLHKCGKDALVFDIFKLDKRKCLSVLKKMRTSEYGKQTDEEILAELKTASRKRKKNEK